MQNSTPSTLRRTALMMTWILGVGIPTAVTSSSHASAPAAAQSATIHTVAAISGPSWSSVLEARSNESAKAKAVSAITAAKQASEKASADAEAAAVEAGARYQETQEEADVAAGKFAQIDEQRRDAQQEADRLSAASGRLTASLARKAGSGGIVESILTADPKHDVLYSLSVSGQVSSKFEDLRTRATESRRVAQGLTNQASRVSAEHARLAELAHTQLDRATAASAAAAAQVEETKKQKATLDAQLVVLRDARLGLEDGYRKAEEARAAEAARVAELARVRAAAAAAAAAAAKPKPGVTPPAPGPGPVNPKPNPGSGWVRAITSYSFYQAYGYRIHPIHGDLRLHAGADFSASLGTPIYSVSAGRVIFAGPSGGYGNLIIIDHGGGITSAYGHMRTSGIYVSPGQQVSAGQNIAGVGSQGQSTGPHLHLEIRRNGTAIDPMVFLIGKGA